MRKYGKIETALWHNPKVRGLSESARLLYLYMISCPHGNSLGCFVLPDGYISADLKWDQRQVSKLVNELVAGRLIERSETSSLIRIIGWFGHNTIENQRVAMAANDTLKTLPNDDVFANLIKELNSINNRFLNEYLNEFRYRARVPEPEPKPEPEPEPESKEVSLSSGDDAPKNSTRENAEQMMEMWNELARRYPCLPAVQKLTERRVKHANLRLDEIGGLEGWQEALEKIEISGHCLGDNDRGWVANFDFMLQPSSLRKLLEGNYDDRTVVSEKPENPYALAILEDRARREN